MNNLSEIGCNKRYERKKSDHIINRQWWKTFRRGSPKVFLHVTCT